MVRELNTPLPRHENSVHVIQAVNGKGNMVAGRDLNIVTERVVKKTVVQTDPGGKHIENATEPVAKPILNQIIHSLKYGTIKKL
jgi:hypothetical protein